MIRSLSKIAVGICLITVSMSAQTFTLYGVSGSNGTASSLFTVNTSTGALTLVGPTGFSGVGSLAFAPNGTTLYGVVNNQQQQGAESHRRGSATSHFLITINTTTGLGTAVSGASTGTGNIADLAFRSDGVLFASGGSDGAANLYTINTTTGVATLVGLMAGSGGGNALAFNAAGTLYLSANQHLFTLNQTTGATTDVATPVFSFLNTSIFDAMKFQPTTGVLFGATNGNDLGSLSTFTGSPFVNKVGNTSVQLEGIAFGSATTTTPPPPPPSTTPVPSTFLLLGTGLALAGGWLFLRGRQAIL